MGFFSHRVSRSELVAGDHIYTYRTGFIYSHHGIYVGSDRVVHFKPSGVIKSCLDCFLSGGSLYRYEYGASECSFILKRGGTCTIAKADAPELVVSRAVHLLNCRTGGGFGDYHLAVNNCEHFAVYCKTRLRTVHQKSIGGSGQVTGFTGAIRAVIDSCSIMAVPSFIGIASSAALGL